MFSSAQVGRAELLMYGINKIYWLKWAVCYYKPHWKENWTIQQPNCPVPNFSVLNYLISNCLDTIYIYTNFIEHNRHFLSTHFLQDPFVLPYCFYRIRRELIYVFSIVVCIPSTFCPTLGHRQGRIYYKSDVTFVFAYYYYVRASSPLKSIAFAFKWGSINSVSS